MHADVCRAEVSWCLKIIFKKFSQKTYIYINAYMQVKQIWQNVNSC